MLDMAAFMADENMWASMVPAAAADTAGASRLPDAQRGTEPDSPATLSATLPSCGVGAGCACAGGSCAGAKARPELPMAAPSAWFRASAPMGGAAAEGAARLPGWAAWQGMPS